MSSFYRQMVNKRLKNRKKGKLSLKNGNARMISLKQIDAALGLLGLNRSDLAEQMVINKSTLNSYFTGKSAVPSKRLGEIQKWFENAGVVFTEQGGVNPNTSDIVTYEGKQGFQAFMDDVYETAKKQGGDIYLFNSRPRLWHEWLGVEWYEMHSKRMQALGDKINVKITVQEGDNVLLLKTAKHKWFPRGLYKNKIFYAYGSKLGFLDFGKDSLRIIVIKQHEFADIFRVLYDVAWENVATEVPQENSHG
jgi:hypothetical protein